jgi:hypothetical protein
MYVVKQVKAQGLSWIWAFIVVTLGLITTAWLWTIYDQIRSQLATSSVFLGANQSHVAFLNSIFAWAPLFVLIGFALFVIIVSMDLRGGDRFQ